ncbi:PREDICTED: uncharacterized protein LOC105448758 isoform X2 [Wasmannia auropunctata]|uniref:uncharacterized protein LOC105448758 isoform X2 n=1 Tax=Wasmannia auropunctata TaxID=64793 RepID=UPI0005EF5DBD|nr:PREDICTED: uncharacterized protein LOC105448758 isoform X2 [Wasmannia auropunctata]
MASQQSSSNTAEKIEIKIQNADTEKNYIITVIPEEAKLLREDNNFATAKLQEAMEMQHDSSDISAIAENDENIPQTQDIGATARIAWYKTVYVTSSNYVLNW